MSTQPARLLLAKFPPICFPMANSKATRPRQAAKRTLKKIPTIALLVESSRASGRALLCGIAKCAHHHGPWAFYWEPGGLEKAWPKLKALDVDGIILRDVDKLQEVPALGIPAVVIGHSKTEIPNMVNVVTDSSAIGRIGAEHLLQCGFKHFAYCGYGAAPTRSQGGVRSSGLHHPVAGVPRLARRSPQDGCVVAIAAQAGGIDGLQR
jgi:DNA-binding LacI/PurR family transcriptional regulator